MRGMDVIRASHVDSPFPHFDEFVRAEHLFWMEMQRFQLPFHETPSSLFFVTTIVITIARIRRDTSTQSKLFSFSAYAIPISSVEVLSIW